MTTEQENSMKFEIKNRFSGEVMFSCQLTAEIASKSYGLQLGFAVKKAIVARANLADANLARADLADADLAGANLADANLVGTNLGEQWIVQGATRSDGYSFFLQKLTRDAEPMVKAGCRYFTIAQAQEHWGSPEYYGGKKLGFETEEIVKSMVRLAKIRDYIGKTEG